MKDNVKLYVSLFALTLSFGFFNADAMKRVEEEPATLEEAKENFGKFLFLIINEKIEVKAFYQSFFNHKKKSLHDICQCIRKAKNDYPKAEFTIEDFKRAYPMESIPKNLKQKTTYMIVKSIQNLNKKDFYLTKPKIFFLKKVLNHLYIFKVTTDKVISEYHLRSSGKQISKLIINELYKILEPLFAALEPFIKELYSNTHLHYYDASPNKWYKIVGKLNLSDVDLSEKKFAKCLKKNLISKTERNLRVDRDCVDKDDIEDFGSHYGRFLAILNSYIYQDYFDIYREEYFTNKESLVLSIPSLICNAMLSELSEKTFKDTLFEWNKLRKMKLAKISDVMLRSNEIKTEERLYFVAMKAYPLRYFILGRTQSCYKDVWKPIFGPALEKWANSVDGTNFKNNLKKNIKYLNVRIICFIE